jgi:hypothetical protein
VPRADDEADEVDVVAGARSARSQRTAAKRLRPGAAVADRSAMSMCLGLVACTDATIARLLDRPALVWRLIAPHDAEAVAAATARPAGWFARWFGRPADPPELPPLPLAAGEGETTELDKAWHGIHWLLTGSAGEAPLPLGFLLGGRPVGDVDVGYGPARALAAAEVRAVQTALAARDDASLRSRFDPAALAAAGVYPDIWDEGDEAWEYLAGNLASLRACVDRAAARGHGLLAWLG